jgi:rhamnosyltransferase
MLKASFILPTRNVPKTIGPLLEAIYGQEYDGEIEVLIMDSSDDETPEIVRKFPVKMVRVEPEDYNYGRTRNEGAAMTDGELLVFLSTDIEIRDKSWLAKLTRPFSDPQVAGVYGRQIPKEGAAPMEQFFIRSAYPAQSRVSAPGDGNLRKGLVMFSNNNSAVRRSVWEKIKLPEMLKSEEAEWTVRVLMAGYKIAYASEATVYHSHHYTLKQVFKEYFDSGATMPALHRGKVVDYSMGRVFLDGVSFVLKEYGFMLKKGYWHWIPYAMLYDFMKFAGLFLGSKQKYMPQRMRRALCKKKNHWDSYRDVIKDAV